MVWRLYERWHILPPEIKDNFDNCTAWEQALTFAYEQIRQIEEEEMAVAGMIKKKL